MELSNELRVRIFAAYWGSNFRYNGSLGVVRKMAGVNRRWNVEEEAPTGDMFRIDKCTILLKPLGQISDEDAVELLKIASYHPQIKDDWENIIPDLRIDEITRLPDCIKIKHSLICFEGYFIIGVKDNMALHFAMQDENEENEEGIWQPHRLTDYLRSKGYDCGYGDIPSLIDARIAIIKQTIGAE